MQVWGKVYGKNHSYQTAGEWPRERENKDVSSTSEWRSGIIDPSQVLHIPILPPSTIEGNLLYWARISTAIANYTQHPASPSKSLEKLAREQNILGDLIQPSMLIDASKAARFLVVTKEENKLVFHDEIFEARIDAAIANAKEEGIPINKNVLKTARMIYDGLRTQVRDLTSPSLGIFGEGSIAIEWDFQNNVSIVVGVHDSDDSPITLSLIDPDGISQMGKLVNLDDKTLSRGIKQLSGWLEIYAKRKL